MVLSHLKHPDVRLMHVVMHKDEGILLLRQKVASHNANCATGCPGWAAASGYQGCLACIGRGDAELCFSLGKRNTPHCK
jgi:hypothetical protein